MDGAKPIGYVEELVVSFGKRMRVVVGVMKLGAGNWHRSDLLTTALLAVFVFTLVMPLQSKASVPVEVFEAFIGELIVLKDSDGKRRQGELRRSSR